MADLRFTKLKEELAQAYVADVKTEFMDKGEVKVFNFLFTDTVELLDNKIVPYVEKRENVV